MTPYRRKAIAEQIPAWQRATKSGSRARYQGFLTAVPWPAFIFLLGLVWPTAAAIHLGDLFLPVYRIILLALFPVLLLAIARARVRLAAPDYLVVGFALAQGLIVIGHHGLFEPIEVISYVSSQSATGIENAGSFFLETAIPYLTARLFIRDTNAVVATMRLQIVLVLAIAITTVVQALTGYSLFAGGYVGGEIRMGLFRSNGPFPHPILWGLFAASSFTFAFLATATASEGWKRTAIAALIFIATVTSASSAPMLAVVVQLCLILWLTISKRLRHRWWYLTAAFVTAYIAIDILSNRTPVHVLFSYATLSPGTGYYRMLIWEYGWANVVNSPLFGIGLNDWTRPFWMNASVDAFWLVVMMRCGLLGFACLVAGLLAAFIQVARTTNTLSVSDRRIAAGWMITFSAYVLGGITVAFFYQSLAHFFFLAGFWGAFISNKKSRSQLRRLSAGTLTQAQSNRSSAYPRSQVRL